MVLAGGADGAGNGALWASARLPYASGVKRCVNAAHPAGARTPPGSLLLVGAEGKGEVGLWCPGRREGADVPGVGSSSGVAWGGGARLLFFPAVAAGWGGEEEGKCA